MDPGERVLTHRPHGSSKNPSRDERAARLVDDLAAIEDRLDPAPAKQGQLLADVITLALVATLWVVVDGNVRYPLLLATLLVAARGVHRLLPLFLQRSLRRERDRLLGEVRAEDAGSPVVPVRELP